MNLTSKGRPAFAAPDFPLPLRTLLPLISLAEERAINHFTPLWSGEAAALASDLPAQRLTVGLATGAIERFRQLGRDANLAAPSFAPSDSPLA